MLEKIVFKVGEKEISLTAEEARSLYADLKKLFGPVSEPTPPKDTIDDWLRSRKPYDPFQKYRDWDWTNPWQPYGPITFDGGTNTQPKPNPGEVI